MAKLAHQTTSMTVPHDVSIMQECLQNDAWMLNTITENNDIYFCNTLQFKYAIQLENIGKLKTIVYNYLESSVDGQSVQTLLSSTWEYKGFLDNKTEFETRYQNTVYNRDFLKSLLVCAHFQLARDHVLSNWDSLVGETMYEKKKRRINMQAADFIMDLRCQNDYYQVLLYPEAYGNCVRDFDAKARMNVCGIVHYKQDLFFRGIVNNWFLTTFPAYNEARDTIGGRNRKQMNADCLRWYYGKRSENQKYENITQLLEQSDNIQYVITLIHRIDGKCGAGWLYLFHAKHDEGYADVATNLQMMSVASIREVMQSYIRNFKQPKLNLRIFNEIIVGYNAAEYDLLWERYDKSNVLTGSDWQYICNMYWTLSCMEKKTRKFFSAVSGQNRFNYIKTKDMLNNSFHKHQMRHDKLHQWMVADEINIKNSEMCAKLISIGGPEILDFFLSTSDELLQKTVGNSTWTIQDLQQKIYGQDSINKPTWQLIPYTHISDPECFLDDDFMDPINAWSDKFDLDSLSLSQLCL